MKTLLHLVILLLITACAQPHPPRIETREFRPLSSAPPSAKDLEQEDVGTKVRVHDLFDRWKLKATVSGGRGSSYADITQECWGKIESEFALTADQWAKPETRRTYYQSVEQKIEAVTIQLLHDRGDQLSASEVPVFMRALKALVWQESLWQQFVRYKNWYFVTLSGGSYNVLDDWTLTQIARSGFTVKEILNKVFFDTHGYCSLTRSLYYGFTEFYDEYLEARALKCNQSDEPLAKILGAYNRYSSGYSACYNDYSPNPDYRQYQIKALGGLKKHFESETWKSFTASK